MMTDALSPITQFLGQDIRATIKRMNAAQQSGTVDQRIKPTFDVTMVRTASFLMFRWCLMLLASGNLLPAQPSASPKTVDRKAPDGQDYVLIEAGRFRMGCSLGDRDCQPDESPAHDVELTVGFWLGQTEVTVEAWQRYRAATGAKALPTKDDSGRRIWNEASSEKDIPVVLVTWKQAQKYCEWAGGSLPTEAQWEYASRAGDTRQRYGEPRDIAWFSNNSGVAEIDTLAISTENGKETYDRFIVKNDFRARAVAKKQPNAWGLFDMLGNASEWVRDWYGPYSSAGVSDPTGAKRGEFRVRRGGSWRGNVRNLRFSTRLYYPNEGDHSAGFRCALSK